MVDVPPVVSDPRADIFISRWSYDPEIDDQVTDEAGRLKES